MIHNDFLDLDSRPNKPRKHGLTCLIDNGYPIEYFRDCIQSHAQFIDYIKFGWGTAYITKHIKEKIAIAQDHQIEFFFGGTFFEKCYQQNKLADFLRYCQTMQCHHIEVSNGSVDISPDNKAKLIKTLAQDFVVFSEVGFKDSIKSNQSTAQQWIEWIQRDLAAGARKVITEAREGGSSGICTANGEVRCTLIDEIAQSGINTTQLIFEAPTKALQVYFIKKFGPEVSLANIAFSDIIGLETLRLGLRADTIDLMTRSFHHVDSE